MTLFIILSRLKVLFQFYLWDQSHTTIVWNTRETGDIIVMWLYHLNTGHPYCLVFRWIRYSGVQYSDGYCITIKIESLTILTNFFLGCIIRQRRIQSLPWRRQRRGRGRPIFTRPGKPLMTSHKLDPLISVFPKWPLSTPNQGWPIRGL